MHVKENERVAGRDIKIKIKMMFKVFYKLQNRIWGGTVIKKVLSTQPSPLTHQCPSRKIINGGRNVIYLKLRQEATQFLFKNTTEGGHLGASWY